MRLPTASSLDRADACPPSVVLPGGVDRRTTSNERGTAIHRFLSRAKEIGRDRALAELDDDELEAECSGIDVAAIPPGAQSEVALAWNWRTDKARVLGYGLERDYSAAHEDEFVGTADLIGRLDRLGDINRGVFVADYKTGALKVRAAKSMQLRALALYAARATGENAATVAMLYLGRDGCFRTDRAYFDAFDLDETAEQLVALVGRIKRAGQAIERSLLGEGRQKRRVLGVDRQATPGTAAIRLNHEQQATIGGAPGIVDAEPRGDSGGHGCVAPLRQSALREAGAPVPRNADHEQSGSGREGEDLPGRRALRGAAATVEGEPQQLRLGHRGETPEGETDGGGSEGDSSVVDGRGDIRENACGEVRRIADGDKADSEGAELEGGGLALATGRHCEYCPVFAGCPAQQKLIQLASTADLDALARFDGMAPAEIKGMFVAQLEAMTPERAGAAVDRVRLMAKVLKAANEAGKDLARRTSDGLPLPGGRVLREMKWSAWAKSDAAKEQLGELTEKLRAEGEIRRVATTQVREGVAK